MPKMHKMDFGQVFHTGNFAIPPDIHTIIHFGAGRCRELPEYLAANPQRIVLVEADSELAAVLKKTTSVHPNVEVRQATVGGESGERTLYICNFRDATSLRSATGMRAIFPGLRVLKEQPVDVVRPDSLLGDLELEPERNNLIVIDVPGEEQQIVESLIKTKILHNFKTIRLVYGKQPLYEGNSEASVVLNLLKDNGYELIQCSSEPDPDRPAWMLTRSDMAIEAIALRERLNDLTKTHDEQVKLAEERQKEIERLTQERDEQNSRQQMLDEELIKAESQIELISDILIREKAF